MRYALVLALVASPALAGPKEAIENHILPNLTTFTEAAGALDDVAQANCEADALKGPYNAAFDAWMRIADIRLGPSEQGVLTISFWPDTKGHTQRTLKRLIEAEDPVVENQKDFAEISVAARGFFALERMLYDADYSDYVEASYACALTRAMTRDLAQQAAALENAWREDFVPVILNPGVEGNTTYLDETEVVRAIYTQVMSSLEVTADTRLGRPLGEPTRPRPSRAEAWRSERSLANTMIVTQSAYDLAVELADWELPETAAAMEQVHAAAEKIEDPGFQNIDDLSSRFDLEILQQAIDGVGNALEAELGVRLGIQPGFNSADGD